jgi:hypothetical protein
VFPAGTSPGLKTWPNVKTVSGLDPLLVTNTLVRSAPQEVNGVRIKNNKRASDNENFFGRDLQQSGDMDGGEDIGTRILFNAGPKFRFMVIMSP